MFKNRLEAGYELAHQLSQLQLHNPLVLAIPNGGMIVGEVVARQLGTELDAVLIRKLRAPLDPEHSIGAVSEGGQILLNNRQGPREMGVTSDYVCRECGYQLEILSQKRHLVRGIRPRAQLRGRNVILVDDGVITGSTLRAAIQFIREQGPALLIAAVPVIPRTCLDTLYQQCDDLIFLEMPERGLPLANSFSEYLPVDDQSMAETLQRHFVEVAEERISVNASSA